MMVMMMMVGHIGRDAGVPYYVDGVRISDPMHIAWDAGVPPSHIGMDAGVPCGWGQKF